MKKVTLIMVLMLGILTISAQEKQRDSKDTKHIEKKSAKKECIEWHNLRQNRSLFCKLKE